MSVFDPNYFDYHALKRMTEKDKEELAGQIREEIISAVSANGGHLSSNLGVVELTICLLTAFDPARDDILFDVGHQCYAYRLLTGRSLSNLRKEGGANGFQTLNDSPYDHFESGHSSTSIATALGIAASKKKKGDDSYTVVVIGDSSIANGLAFEGLNSLDSKTYGKLIIILNDNNMSISRPRGALSSFFNHIRTSAFYQESAGRFKKLFDHRGLRWIYKGGKGVKDFTKKVFTAPNFFDSFNCSYLGPINGHDIAKTTRFLNRAKTIDRSVILHVRTKKGKGYALAEEDEEGYWHGTGPFDPDSGLPLISHPELLSFSHASGDAIRTLLQKDPLAVLISPAMAKGAHLEPCFTEFPDRCYDVGIAEEEAVSLAAGFALKGLHPIVSVYSTFFQRGFDQAINDISRMKLSVLFVIDRVGLVGNDGSSHQGIFDEALELLMPFSRVLVPSSLNEVSLDIAREDFSFKGPSFIRVERCYGKKKDLNYSYRKEVQFKPYQLKGDNKAAEAVICSGLEGKQVFDRLPESYLGVLINEVRPLSDELMSLLLSKKEITIYDPTSVAGGKSAFISCSLFKKNYQGKIKVCAIPKAFIAQDSRAGQIKKAGLLPEDFIKNFPEKSEISQEKPL